MTTLREAAQQALEALAPWMDSDHTVQHAAYHALRAALAQQPEPVAWIDALKDAFFEGFTSVATYNDTLLNSPEEAWENYKLPHIALAQQAEPVEPVLQTCNCRWDGEVQVQQCTLHEAHVDAIHEWAERAKVAERKLAQQAEPVAWVRLEAWKSGQSWPDDCFTALPAEGLTPLHTAPPQRKPLTEEEIRLLARDTFLEAENIWNEDTHEDLTEFARAVERAHGITDPQVKDRLASHGIPKP